jgi:hypothetical protein
VFGRRLSRPCQDVSDVTTSICKDNKFSASNNVLYFFLLLLHL